MRTNLFIVQSVTVLSWLDTTEMAKDVRSNFLNGFSPVVFCIPLTVINYIVNNVS